MPTFRRKPIEVFAIQVGSIPHKKLAAWCDGEIIRDGNTIVGIRVPMTGVGMARPGDWVIRETKASTGGEFYIFTRLKDEWFQEEYQRYYSKVRA